MSEFAASYPWALPVLCLLIGVFLGAIGAQMFERKKSGGRTVEAVQQEMNEYKEEVGKHFATTSELFRDMTEKYRDVYNHLASGSQDLCEDEITVARLEYAENRSVADDDTPTDVSDSVDESVAEPAPEKVAEATPEKTASDSATSVDGSKNDASADVSDQAGSPSKS